jgi:hypothetical protein
MDEAVVQRALARHTAAREALEGRVTSIVTRLVAGFDGWYDRPAITAWTAEIVRAVEAAQYVTATTTDAYLSAVASEVIGQAVLPVGAVDPSELRSGVTHQGVYGRLADQWRYQESLGTAANVIAEGVASRAVSMVATDLQLAFTHQSRRFLTERGISGYRRVIRPELSKDRAVCGLCIAASDQIYKSGVLMPIHGNCNCDILPVKNGVDPGKAINRDDLDRIYAESGGTYADSLIETKFVIREHGEIGPVLTREGDAFRGPADVAAAAK